MRSSQQNRYWWFGVNNRKKRYAKTSAHVIYPEISPFLDGQQNILTGHLAGPDAHLITMNRCDLMIKLLFGWAMATSENGEL